MRTVVCPSSTRPEASFSRYLATRRGEPNRGQRTCHARSTARLGFDHSNANPREYTNRRSTRLGRCDLGQCGRTKRLHFSLCARPYHAYSWEPPEGGYRANSGEQDVVRSKALQLNFWRGGDGEDLHDNEMLFGIPLYPNDPKRQANVLKTYQIDKPERHRWVYR